MEKCLKTTTVSMKYTENSLGNFFAQTHRTYTMGMEYRNYIQMLPKMRFSAINKAQFKSKNPVFTL